MQEWPKWCYVKGLEPGAVQPALDVGNGVILGFNPSTFIPGAWLTPASKTRDGSARYCIMPGPRTDDERPLVAVVRTLTAEREDLQSKLKFAEDMNRRADAQLAKCRKDCEVLAGAHLKLKEEFEQYRRAHARHGLSLAPEQGGELSVASSAVGAVSVPSSEPPQTSDAEVKPRSGLTDRLARWFGQTEPDTQ